MILHVSMWLVRSWQCGCGNLAMWQSGGFVNLVAMWQCCNILVVAIWQCGNLGLWLSVGTQLAIRLVRNLILQAQSAHRVMTAALQVSTVSFEHRFEVCNLAGVRKEGEAQAGQAVLCQKEAHPPGF